MTNLYDPNNWKNKTALQQPSYPDKNKADQALNQLRTLPHLVTSQEIDLLKKYISQAQRGERFLLQGGDCAEAFSDCTSSNITNKLKILLQMSLIMLHGMRKPITRIGRMAGQFAKPRSSDTETVDGITLPSYRGDIINNAEFTEKARTADPDRLLQAYYHSAATLNYIRALTQSGFADLHHPEYWNIQFAKENAHTKKYHQIVKKIADAIDFCSLVDSTSSEKFSTVDFFISHEALLLAYESALTTQINNKYYNLGTHFPWIGMRTGQINGAHMDYLKGIENPIGIKIGPTATQEWLLEVLNTLNPNNDPGKIMLIHRFGSEKIATLLPKFIETIKQHKKTVLWSCDPMHGNTKTTDTGIKTRYFDQILSELKQSFNIHEQNNSILGAVHFEMTGENVTECVGGSSDIKTNNLTDCYTSQCDPRLNYQQALELALLIAHEV